MKRNKFSRGLVIILLFLPLLTMLVNASEWKVMHGKYVDVEFNPGFEALADSLTNMADRAIPRLAMLQGVQLTSFEELKTRIILTDAPDISNGYAIENAVVIFARSSMYLEATAGPFNWYQRVLEHELVHHVSFRAISRKGNILGLVASISTPRWFMEGIAQYHAEVWSSLRGDIYLKEAVLNGSFNYDALFSLDNGRLLYAAGHAYIRYLADQYGDSSLINLVRHDSEALFYDFDDAFKSVYKKSAAELFPYFVRHLTIYYGNLAADFPVLETSKTLPSFGFRDLQIIPLTEADSTYLVSSIKQSNHLYKSAFIVEIKNGKTKIIDEITDNFSTNLFISPDQQFIAYGRQSFGYLRDQQTINYSWYIYEREKEMTKLVAENIRARNAVFDANNNLLLAINQANKSIIRKYQLNENTTVDLFRTDMPIGQMTLGNAGQIIFEGQAKSKQRDLFSLEKSLLTNLTNDVSDNRKPVLINENFIAFNQMVDRNLTIALLNISNGQTAIKINQQFPLVLQSFNKRTKSLVTSQRDAAGNVVFFEIPLDTLLIKNVAPLQRDYKPKYASWTERYARSDSLNLDISSIVKDKKIDERYFPQGDLINLQTLPLPIYDQDYGAGLFLTSSWAEAMTRNILNINALIYPQTWDESFLSVVNNIKVFNVDIITLYYHGPGIFTRINGEYRNLNHDYGQIGFGLRRYFSGNARFPYKFFLGYNFDKIEKSKSEFDYSYHGLLISSGIGYELPSRYKYIFSKRAFLLTASYYQSLAKEWDFSTLNIALKLSTNLIIEKLGIISRVNFVNINGQAAPSAVTGIDQDYFYNVPRDFRSTKTIRGVKEDIFGKQLYWSSSELKYFLFSRSALKLLFIPINDLAMSAFLDAARVNTAVKNDLDIYSIGTELSFGFDFLRFSAGFAQGYIDNKKLSADFYSRINLELDDIF